MRGNLALQSETTHGYAALSNCMGKLVRDEPFYGHIIVQLESRTLLTTTKTNTIGVGIDEQGYYLVIHPEFFFEQLESDRQRVAVLKHEALHIVFDHVYTGQEHRGWVARIFNIAADIVVNQYINPEDLPKSAVTISDFPELNLKPWKSVDYYFKILQKKMFNNVEINVKLLLKVVSVVI